MTRRLLLLACCLCLLAGVAAAEAIPCDRDGDGTLASAELAAAILDSLDGRCMGGTVEAPSPTDLQDAAFIYTHWDGRALTITDSSGRTTTVFRPLRRIVLLNDYHPKVMQLLDVEPDRIVGVEPNVFKDPLRYPKYQEKPNVGTISSPDYEQIALLHPDAVIFGTRSGSTDKAEETLGSIDPDIRFFNFQCFQLPTYVDDVQKLSLLLGKGEEAARFLAFRGNVLDTVAGVVDKMPAENRTSVYLELSSDYSSAGRGSSYHEMIELAGGRNVVALTAGSTGSATVDPEVVVMGNPDVIFKRVGGARITSYSDDALLSSFETVQRSIMSRPAWDQINAVRNGRVYSIHGSFFSGSEKFVGIAYMAKLLYPDLFPDLDPRAIHQQYLREFQRVDYDLDKHGAFVYPT